jgi:hypothetical protein
MIFITDRPGSCHHRQRKYCTLPINHHHDRGKCGEFSDKHKVTNMDTSQGNNHALASAGHGPASSDRKLSVRSCGIANRNKCLLVVRHGSHRCRTPLKNFLTDANGFEMATRTDDVYFENAAMKCKKAIAFDLARRLY